MNVVLCTMFAAWSRRMFDADTIHGWDSPRAFDVVLLAIPYALTVGWLAPENLMVWAAAGIIVAQFTIGHGSYIDMGDSGIPDNETTGKIFLFWWPDDGFNVNRDIVGMFIRYFVPLVIAYSLITSSGVVFAIAVAVDIAVAYYLLKQFVKHYTEYAEYILGAAVYLGFVGCLNVKGFLT